MPLLPKPPGRGRELVALTLAIGIAVALNIIVFAVLWDALFSDVPGLSNNATQILTGWGGGIIGVVGSYLGYRAGAAATEDANADRAGESDDTGDYPADAAQDVIETTDAPPDIEGN